ncbi:EDD domain protein, DegV family [Mesotoga infera]|jgi:DegV family protein with EDD domain|uniref:EDD domain protein, DegV family n=1 Tax=Mesotoga infera TaxID=1236046 RepID=A0A7Z7PNW0_9BACT|nr:DegV family protein [Mesotoga infera]SSC12691.1 EDD domain protein, DegV family [Mesotoga infera]
MIGIIVDSGCDLPEAIKEKTNVRVIPLKVVLEGKEYRDNIDITTEQLLEFMENKFPKTSLPGYNDIGQAFESLYKEGVKEIVFVGISSGLSGTLGLVKRFSEDFIKNNPDSKVHIVDSKNISIASGLVAMRGVELSEQGATFDEVVLAVEEAVKKSKVFFCIPVLKYLKAGGRIGKVSATIGDILDLKPVITVGEDGIYHSVSKDRGMRRAVNTTVRKLLEYISGKKARFVAAYTSDRSEKSLEYFRTIVETLESQGIKNIITGQISQSLVAHTGPGLIGVAALVE